MSHPLVDNNPGFFSRFRAISLSRIWGAGEEVAATPNMAALSQILDEAPAAEAGPSHENGQADGDQAQLLYGERSLQLTSGSRQSTEATSGLPPPPLNFNLLSPVSAPF